MQAKIALSITLTFILLFLGGCAETAPVNTIAPAELTPGEEDLLKKFTDLYYVFDYSVGTPVNHIGYHIWIEQYEQGVKVAEHTLTHLYSSGFQEPESPKDRIILAKISETDSEESWLASIGGASVEPTLPKLPAYKIAAGTEAKQFELGQPVLLAFFLDGEPPLTWHTGVFCDQGAFQDLISNDSVTVIFMKMYQREQTTELLGP